MQTWGTDMQREKNMLPDTGDQGEKPEGADTKQSISPSLAKNTASAEKRKKQYKGALKLTAEVDC